MPDLLGPNPCEGCDNNDGSCNGIVWTDDRQEACGPYAAYAAKRELLEALKAGGVKVKDDKLKTWGAAGAEIANKSTGPGHLIFIPEAQE
jgi:hypothetical protein